MEQESKKETAARRLATNKTRSNSVPDFFGRTNLSIDGSLSDSIDTSPAAHHRTISNVHPFSPVAANSSSQPTLKAAEKEANLAVMETEQINVTKKDTPESDSSDSDDSESSSEYSDSSSDSPLPHLYPTQKTVDSLMKLELPAGVDIEIKL